MIDSNEPKNGDYVTYVENLVRLPEGMRIASDERSPGEVGRGGAFRDRLTGVQNGQSAPSGTQAMKSSRLAELAGGSAQAWGRSVGSVFGHPARGSEDAGHDAFGRGRSSQRAVSKGSPTLDIEQAARTLAKVVGRVGGVMVLAGLALLAMTFADAPLFDVDPGVGIALAVTGAVLRKVAGRVS